MKVKRYLARDMNEAVQMIKQDLGPNALIIRSRKVRKKGFLGILRGKVWEVTAAVEEVPGGLTVPEIRETDNYDLKHQLAELKEMIQVISREKENGGSPGEKDGRRALKYILLNMEIKEDLVENLLDGVEIPEDSGDSKDIYQVIQPVLIDKIDALLEPIYCDLSPKKILVFVGPTGVGKTTTLAKLAAQSSFFKGERVGIITIDTYRIGAVEQLKTYAEIIGVPIEVVLTPAELEAAVRRMADKDVIFIDTAGRSFKNIEYINELKQFLERLSDVEVLLVLSSNTKQQDLINNVKNFGNLRFSRLIFTKADETDILGNILNIILETQVPVAYITNGQNVPDDIEQIYPQKLAQLVLKGVNLTDGPGL